MFSYYHHHHHHQQQQHYGSLLETLRGCSPYQLIFRHIISYHLDDKTKTRKQGPIG
uniref:Uncharacterized protein n=1 Tax=Octopus bimaculoides TaxID=37653 RepID=A0A0L8HGU1_OCTBM